MRGKLRRALEKVEEGRITPAHARKTPSLSCQKRPRGITPAYAGKTQAGVVERNSPRDHPRACGENSAETIRRIEGMGSPPRVRGKLEVACIDCGTCGITPACAGKTPQIPRPARVLWDHPRVCGENVSASSSLGRHG